MGTRYIPHLTNIFRTTDKDTKPVSENLDVVQFVRKSFPVDAVRVTEENLEEVARWCDGELRNAEDADRPVGAVGDQYIKVRVHNPLTERQTKAFVGDWVLYAGKGYKVYTDKAFRKSFDPPANKQVEAKEPIGMPPTPIAPIEANVFVNSEEAESGTFSAGGGGGSTNNPGGTHVVG
jgi:hypothetical protein